VAQDPDAWRRLVKIYGPLVYRWARRSGLQVADAEDTVGDVFTDVLQGIARFRFDGSPHSFRRWLRTVCSRKVKKRIQQVRSQPMARGGSTARLRLDGLVANVLPEDEVAKRDEIDWVRQQAMRILQDDFKPAHWQIFRRCVLEGEAPADVARAMGMTVWAVYKARSRILHRLRVELDDFV